MLPTPISESNRRQYLLGGRRVRVADLISASLLLPGATLTFNRKRSGDVYRATVLDNGHVRLEDNRTYRSLSQAAASAAGVRALDGWHVWVVDGSDETMDDLRQQLLDQVAQEDGANAGESPETAEEAPPKRHERLKAFRTRAEADDPVEMSVHELLALWGAEARGHRVINRIDAELTNHGLTTVPHWQKVTMDTRVRLETQAEDEDAAGIGSTFDHDEEDEQLEVGLTVGNLPSAMAGVCSVTPSASMEEAVTLMLLNDFSQLAVLAGARSLKGAVTWRSIAQSRHANPKAELADAIAPAEEVPYDREVIDLLPTLYSSEFAFVRDQTGVVSGILTAADVVLAYGELATPFLLFGELDQLLRRTISQTFELDQVSELCNPEGKRPISSFDDLSFGDYQQVLQNPERWVQLSWPLDRTTFCKRLDELREIRNDVMHFNPDPVPVGTTAKLRGLIRLLREYGE